MRLNHHYLASVIAVLILSTLVTALSGCGFQRRGHGQELDALPSPFYISGIGRYSSLHRALERELAKHDVPLATDAAGAAALLHIAKHRSESRVLTLDGRNKVVETELEESAHFQVRSPNAADTATQTARVIRIHFQPSTQVLGAEREAVQVREDMRRELAQRILRRVAAHTH